MVIRAWASCQHGFCASVLQDATWEKETREHMASLDVHSSPPALISLPLASFLSVPRAGLKQESTCRSFPSAEIIGMCHQAHHFWHYFFLRPLQSFFPPEDPLVSHVLTLWLTVHKLGCWWSAVRDWSSSSAHSSGSQRSACRSPL